MLEGAEAYLPTLFNLVNKCKLVATFTLHTVFIAEDPGWQNREKSFPLPGIGLQLSRHFTDLAVAVHRNATSKYIVMW
jgi:hypothetical protein